MGLARGRPWAAIGPRDELLGDDAVWDRVWERMIGPVERNAIARTVWRRALPDDPFHARVGAELARRWRRRAVYLAVVYGTWTLFWGSLALRDWRADAAFAHPLSPGATMIGVTAVLLCGAARRRLRGVARTRPVPTD